MKLPEWTRAVIEELAAAGFEVREHDGFPLAIVPKTHAEIVRFLKFQPSLGADRTICAEGALFTPAGARAWVDRKKEQAAQ